MDCEVCIDRIVELLYGGLPDAEAAATRAHIEGCETCTEAFEHVSTGQKLASMLELAEPPASVLDSVMAAAREKAVGKVSVAPSEPDRAIAKPPREDEEEGGLFASILQWIGGFAMRPQMAMAMMLFLMVGLGMWYLPTLRQVDPADSQSIMGEAPGAEVGPSAGLEPATPLDLHADPVTRRIRPRDDSETGARITERPRPAPPPEEPTLEDPLVQEPENPAMAAVAHEPTPSPGVGEVLEDPLPDPRVEGALYDVAPGERMAVETEAGGLRPSQPRVGMATQQTQTAPIPSPEPRPVAPQPAPNQANTSTEHYERGLQRMRQHDYRGATDDFEAVVQRPDTDARRLLPSALHHLANSQRSSGDCAAAVRSYDRLLTQHSTYSGSAEAMMETADCYRRMGRISDARRMLEQAQTRPSVATRARRELADLGARERAMDRATAAEPEP